MKKTLLTVLLLATAGMASADITQGKTYRIASAANEERVMFVTNSSAANNASVVIWTDTEVPAQQWEATANDNGTFHFKNVFTGKYLARNSALVSTSSKLVQNSLANANGQWTVEAVEGNDGYYTLKQSTSTATFVLQTSAADDGDGLSFAAWTDGATPTSSQMWKIEEVEPISEFGDAQRKLMIDAWLAQHLRDRGTTGKTFGNGGGWGDAEMLETMLDAYEMTGRQEYLDVFKDVFTYFRNSVGTYWNVLKYDDQYKWYGHDFNDDVMWMIIASVRAYHLTGTTLYRTLAKNNFDRIYDRAFNQWGMMRWAEQSGNVNGTNSCINGPTEVAACYIAMSLTDETQREEYFEIARNLYEKQRLYLFNRQTGEVYDAFTWDETTNLPSGYNRWVSTYNQGTMLGAALMLYRHYGDEMYLNDAHKIVERTKSSLCNDEGVVDVCQTVDGDLCGFKGILMRYLRRYVVETQYTDGIQWLKDNAFMAFNNRNSAGITSSAWLTKANEDWLSDTENDSNGNPKSFASQPFGNSTAVSAAFNAPLNEYALRKNAYETIEAEHFNTLRGVYVVDGTGGTESEIGNIRNNYYTAYSNVDFGTRPAQTVDIRVSDSSVENASIEVRLDSYDGTLIGQADVPTSGGWKTLTIDIAPVDGMHDVYFVYRTPTTASSSFNVDWMVFATDAQELPGDITNNGGDLTASVDGTQTDALTDNSLTTAAIVDGSTVTYTYISPIAVKPRAYAIASTTGDATADPAAWTLSASNDGSTWIDLDSQTGATFDARCQLRRFDAQADRTYTQFRLSITANNGATTTAIGEWQMYGLAITSSDITADGGTQAEGDAAATDKNASTTVSITTDAGTNYRYNSRGLYEPTCYSITAAPMGNAPKAWTLYGYANTEWVVIDQRSGQTFPYNGCTQFYKVTGANAYQNFRLIVDTEDGGSQMAEIQIFGNLAPNGVMYNEITDNGGTISSSDNADETALRPLIDNEVATTYTLPFDGSAWIEYISESPITPTSVRLSAGHDTDRAPKAWTIQGSNDGSTWTTLATVSNARFNTRGAFRVSNITTNNSYTHIRLNFTQAYNDAADALNIAELQIHGRCIAANSLLSTGGTLTANIDGVNTNESVDKLIDSSADTKYVFNYLGNPWIEYESTTQAAANMYSITSANDEASRDPKGWELQGSQNGRTWTTLDTRTDQTFLGRYNTQFYIFDNETPYNFYRLVITDNNGATLAQLSEWQLFYNEKIATGIDNMTSGDMRLNVYPNPVSDILYVDIPAAGTATIYNMSGQAVATTSLNAGQNAVPFAQYGSGMYIVKVTTEGKTLSTKVIK